MRNERVSGGDPFQAGVFRVDPRRNIVSCAGRETHLAPKVIDALAFLAGLFAGVGIKLIDFKVEFGRQYDGDLMRLIVADEISPDSCRLWDMETGDIMDKDRFRKDLGNVTDAYREVAKRLGVLRENENAGQRGPVLVSDNEK